MKKRFTLIYSVLLLFTGLKNVQGQTWTNCNTATVPNGVPYNDTLVKAKAHFFYFGQVWHGELLMNNTPIFTGLFGSSSVQYSIRHFDNSNLNSKFAELSQQLTSMSGLTPLNVTNGTSNDISFWNSRMSAGQAGLGENMLIGFVRTNGPNKECLYVTKKWKDLSYATSSGNFNNKNDKLLSDRTTIYNNNPNKAHIIINTQNTSCTETQNVTHNETPPTGQSSPTVTPKVNHFFYKNFTDGTTKVTLQYQNCSGTSGGSTGGPSREINIAKINSAASIPSISSTTDLGCVGGKRKMQFSFTGGTGVYEMNQPGKKTFFPSNGELLDEYTLVDNTHVFGTDYLLLNSGTQTIKVRDAQKYDQFIGNADPADGDEAMQSLLKTAKDSYYTFTVNVPSCSLTPCFTLSANSQTGGVNSSLTLNPNCSGSDCGSVSYSWSRSAQNGQGAQSGSGLTVILPSVAGTYVYVVTGTKSGCTTQTVNITVTVTSSGNCNLTVTAAYNCSSYVLETVTVTGGSGNYTYNIDGCENSIAKNTMGYTGEAAKYVDYTYWWQQLTVGTHTLYIKDKNNPSYCGSTTLTVPCTPTGSPTTINCSSPSCFTLSSNNQTATVNSSLTLNPNCSGSDCGTVSYTWSRSAQNGQGAQSGSGLTVILPSVAGTYVYVVTGTKSGCTTQTVNITVTVNGSCNFTLSGNPQTGAVNSSLTLNPNCSGSDCGMVSYSWSRSAQNGQGAQSGSGLTVSLPSVAGTYVYVVTGTKSGCSSQTTNITVTVTGSGNCNLTVTAAYNCSSYVLETVTVTGGSGNYTYNIDGCENSIAKNTMGYTGEAAKYVDYAFWWQQLTTGNHTLYIKDKNNPSYCGSTTLTISCAPTGSPTTICGSGRQGIEEEKSSESPSFSLYPNPAGNTINYQLTMDKDKGKANVYIYSVIGQRLYTKEVFFTQKLLKEAIDISQLNSGDYFLQVEENAKLVTKKFVKK